MSRKEPIFAAKYKTIIMTSMTIQVENPSILDSLRTILGAIDGVKIVKTTQSPSGRNATETTEEELPNDVTLASMQEVADDSILERVNIDSIDDFVKSMQ